MSFYTGKIKVVGADLLCFAVSPETLAPLSTGTYDAYAWRDPDPEPIETIDIAEWHRRRAKQRTAERG